MEVEKNPLAGKKLKREFALLRSYQYTVKGQARRLVYRLEKDLIILFSFGPQSATARRNKPVETAGDFPILTTF